MKILTLLVFTIQAIASDFKPDLLISYDEDLKAIIINQINHIDDQSFPVIHIGTKTKQLKLEPKLTSLNAFSVDSTNLKSQVYILLETTIHTALDDDKYDQHKTVLDLSLSKKRNGKTYHGSISPYLVNVINNPNASNNGSEKSGGP